MGGVPLKPQYGPTLGQLLSPRWRRASRPTRLLVAAGGVALLAALVALVFALLPARFSYDGGTAPFAFSYRGLYRTAPGPGEYVRVQRRSGGVLHASFAVGPLRLPPYSGSSSAALPLYATGYVKRLAARYRDFELEGEGRTQLEPMVAYNVYYTARVEGRTMYGRNVLLLPERAGARDGATITMLSLPHTEPKVTSPEQVATEGVLDRALRTFSLH